MALILGMRRLAIVFLTLGCFLFFSWAGDLAGGVETRLQRKWVDSVFLSLSPQQRVGQLFMVSAYSNKDGKHKEYLEKLVDDFGVGGVIFFQGGPMRQVTITNSLQARTKVPLLVAMDAEWGLSMRLDSTPVFPKQMALGAQPTPDGTYKMATEIAREAKRVGVNVSFSPVIDVNSNPKNPVIGFRAFSENKQRVTDWGKAYVKGLQENGVMANVKHFPGHGDAGQDSHYTLPTISRSKEELDQVELYPFKALFDAGVMSVMVAHLHIPAYDTTKNLATSLSKQVVKKLLKDELKFKGLIFTDGLNMKGVANFFKPGQLEVAALKAGNDILLCSENVPLAHQAIMEALANGELDPSEIDQRVKKVLAAKYQLGLNKRPKEVAIRNLHRDLNTPYVKQLNKELYQKSATVAGRDSTLVPIKDLTQDMISISVNAKAGNGYIAGLDNYVKMPKLSFDGKSSRRVIDSIVEATGNKKLIIVSLHDVQSRAKNYNIPEGAITLLPKLKLRGHKVIVLVFGSAYSMKLLGFADQVVCFYEDNQYTQEIGAQVLFGALDAPGILPVSPGTGYTYGMGYKPQSLGRLAFGSPEEQGFNSEILSRIDTLAKEVISQQMAPGCQVLIARNGQVVYNKAFGKMAYNEPDSVNTNTLYDLASITKVASTLQAVMYLWANGQINLEDRLGFYLPELVGTNKENIRIRELLMHRAGLQAYQLHWKKTLVNNKPSFIWYCDESDNDFNVPVTKQWYGSKNLPDSIWKWTINSSLIQPQKRGGYPYKYSDLSFYFLQRLAERILKMPIEEWTGKQIYSTIGAETLGFNPLKKYPAKRISPTELDTTFRQGMIRGSVHDQGAAMLGGVGGHAGLFSNALDLAKLMQMNLQEGYYGGRQFFRKGTMRYFANLWDVESGRGLGWDKPPVDKKEKKPVSQYASNETYGHTGFTGTCVWVDPVYNLTYIFLSNRVHPDANNQKLIKSQIRGRIHDVAYEAMFDRFPFVASNKNKNLP